MSAAVLASGVSRRFGETVALDGVGIAVRAGEIHGLLGANGAGKTTLLRILFGLSAPDAGSVSLLDRRLAGPGSAALDGVGGFVEEPAFYPYLSGAANLTLLARLDGSAHADVAGALDRVGLADRARDRFGGYSTGMRQRLGIAAALLREPRVLLLDEPTSGLDPAGSVRVAALLRELAEDGVAVLLSSHQIGELERVCDGYTFLHRGRITWEGTAAAMRAQAPAAAYALSTSDDARAGELLAGIGDLALGAPVPGGLTLQAGEATLDAAVLALGARGIAVRRLEQITSPLESMFFAQSGERPPGVALAAATPTPTPAPAPEGG